MKKHRWAWWRKKYFLKPAHDIGPDGRIIFQYVRVSVQQWADSFFGSARKLMFIVRKTDNQRRRARRRLVSGRRR